MFLDARKRRRRVRRRVVLQMRDHAGIVAAESGLEPLVDAGRLQLAVGDVRTARVIDVGTRAGFEQDAFGHESNEFAPCRLHTMRGGFGFHDLEDAMQRRLIRIDKVNRDLRLTIDFESQPFHVA